MFSEILGKAFSKRRPHAEPSEPSRLQAVSDMSGFGTSQPGIKIGSGLWKNTYGKTGDSKKIANEHDVSRIESKLNKSRFSILELEEN